MNDIIQQKLSSIWDIYGKSLKHEYIEKVSLNEKLVEEFFFVILGGFGISYELNKSAHLLLSKKGFLNKELYIDEENLREVYILLREELGKPQFEPRTNNNELRRYRFIETKPKTITHAGNWLWRECNWNLEQMLNKKEIDLRAWLCTCPGIGLKSASWYLRNVGYNYDLAVLDVHVLRFLSYFGIEVPKTINDNTYLYLESLLRTACNNIGISLGSMDYLLWILARNGYLKHMG